MRGQGPQAFLAGFFSARGGDGELCLLPSWSVSGSGLKDFTQEKSVFCRIR